MAVTVLVNDFHTLQGIDGTVGISRHDILDACHVVSFGHRQEFFRTSGSHRALWNGEICLVGATLSRPLNENL